tara:strand:- start:2752 stop:3489 length:738 start_codon:yes stop_codon:yes gene_type:complete
MKKTFKIDHLDHFLEKEKPMKKRVVSLSRVSTRKQSDNGVSLAEQKRQIRAYCKLYGHQVVCEIEDVGSGSNGDRKGLQEALEMLKNGSADSICILRLDRISRSLFLFHSLLENYFKEGKYTLLSVEDHFDSSCPNSMLITNIIASVAQWELGRITQRTNEAIQHLKRSGKRTGSVPFGFTVDSENNLIPDKKEKSIIRRIRSLRKQGLSYAKISDSLYSKGFTNRVGKPIDRAQVRRIFTASLN